MRGLERPVIRQVVSVACGAEHSEAPQDVSTQTKREFVVGASSSGEGESGSAITEGPMYAGGSSVETVIGAVDQPEASGGVDASSVPVVGSPLVGNAIASSSCLVRSGKLNNFNDHVIHCSSNMFSLARYLGCF